MTFGKKNEQVARYLTKSKILQVENFAIMQHFRSNVIFGNNMKENIGKMFGNLIFFDKTYTFINLRMVDVFFWNHKYRFFFEKTVKE